MPLICDDVNHRDVLVCYSYFINLMCLFIQAKREEAEQWFVKAMELDQNDGSVYQHYGK